MLYLVRPGDRGPPGNSMLGNPVKTVEDGN